MRHLREDYDAIQPWPTKRPHFAKRIPHGTLHRGDAATQLVELGDAAPIIPDDEPVFVLRAKDVIAPHLVRQWAHNRRALRSDAERQPGRLDRPLLPWDDLERRVLAWADEMQAYAAEHYGGGKTPDTPSELLR